MRTFVLVAASVTMGSFETFAAIRAKICFRILDKMMM
jgi:hypothetical protein